MDVERIVEQYPDAVGKNTHDKTTYSHRVVLSERIRRSCNYLRNAQPIFSFRNEESVKFTKTK